MLKVQGLKKRFLHRPNGRFFERRQWIQVVDGISFEVHEGEIVGLLGPNGAGKTTSFRMTCGMIEPDAGTVQLAGRDVTDWPMYRRAKEGGMGYLAQEKSVFRKLTTVQNLLGVMEMLGYSKRYQHQRCEELLDRFDLNGVRNRQGILLSGGQVRRLEIARALCSQPKIILLDEPFAGIDPKTIHIFQDLVLSLRDDGISILITDHRERETLEITDRSYIVVGGKILCGGTPTEVLANPRAREHYFGSKKSKIDTDPQDEVEVSTPDEAIADARTRIDGPAAPAPHLGTGNPRHGDASFVDREMQREED